MKIVCITGMHRSGTSLVSRVVNLLGVDLGPEDELMPAKPDNPRGFWENSAISAVNDDLLGALGGRWDDPPVLADGWEQQPSLDELRARAAAILERLQARPDAGPALAWKDPRNSLLSPFWRTVTPIDSTIVTVRHPAQVAASLATRDGLDAETSAHLWLRYLVAAWRSDAKRLPIRFSDLFADLDRQVDRIVEYLGVAEPDDATRAAIAEFVEPALRHHVDAPVEAGPNMALAMALFEMFDTSQPALDPMLEALHRMWLAESELEPLRAERDVVVSHRDELLEERRVAVARGEELDRTLAAVAAERDRLQEHLAAVQAQHAEAQARLTAVQAQQAEVQARLAEAEEELVGLRDAHERAADLEMRVKAQVHALDQTERVAAALRVELVQREQEARHFEQQVRELDVSLRRWRIDRLERLLRRLRLL